MGYTQDSHVKAYLEQKKLEDDALALYGSDESPLKFMVESNVSFGYVPYSKGLRGRLERLYDFITMKTTNPSGRSSDILDDIGF